MTPSEFDENFKRKVWGLILKGCVEHFNPPRKEKTWHERLEELGIQIFRYGDSEPGFVEVSHQDESLMGGVRVPVELALKMIILGHMPEGADRK